MWASFVVAKLLLFLALNLFDEVCATGDYRKRTIEQTKAKVED